ncbi:DUF5686 and carboxypeptidase-like regulatory domain-containing protein [Parapedobacter lycopersici]|uniref:DUF5686 and carboxypeptidase-like regulatory domain-containing protein n=1 Tax=Parapedobacter lycopersici TaxID=1864939 RepID=UPI00214DA1AA|nr:DUF5686 and carboxypeptidase-like regulatory domain-containing protein [Parapedobacter lycopersici]
MYLVVVYKKTEEQQSVVMAMTKGKGIKGIAIRQFALETVLLFIFLVNGFGAFAQLTIRGRVTDASTGEGISGVSVVLRDTDIGTSTDRAGFYSLFIPHVSRSITFDALGYKALVTQLPQTGDQTLNVQLEENIHALDEVMVEGKGRYRNRDNPAVALIRQVIQHKPLNRLARYDYVSFQRYEKVMLAVSNPPKGLLNSGITRGYRFALENTDTTLVPGKALLPVFLEEHVARQYLRAFPKAAKTLVTAHRKTELDPRYVNNRNIEAYMEYIHGDVDIYDDNILILNKPFLGPTAESAPLFYKYYITDTLSTGEGTFIELTFVPRNREDRLFAGKLQVTLDGNYGIRQADIRIGHEANLNWVTDVTISQRFNRQGNGIYLLGHSDMRIHFGLTGGKRGAFGQRTLVYGDYDTQQQTPDRVFDGQPASMVAGADLVPDRYWKENRPVPLTSVEANTYTNFDSLRNNRAFKRTLDWGSVLLSSFKRAGPVEIGPVEYMYSYNELEGSRVRIGGRTSPLLSDKIYGEAYAAYGFRDERVKFYLGTAYTLNGRPVAAYPAHYIQATYQQDAREPGQRLGFRNGDSFVRSFRRDDQDKWLYNKAMRLNHVIEFGNHFMLQTHVATLRQTPAAQLHFISAGPGADTLRGLQTAEWGLSLRWAPHEAFLQRNVERTPMINKFPVFNLRYNMGVKGLLGSDYGYHALRFDVFKRVFLSQLGFADVNMGAGYIFGTLPFPLLDIPNANQTYVLSPDAYSLMEDLEFVSDQYVKFSIEHRLNGFILNKIPLIKRLKLREIISFRLLYGNVRPENRPENGGTGVFRLPTDLHGNPTTFTLGQKPYMETAFGLENILNVFRIEYVTRLSYLGHLGADRNGIRIGASLSF